MNVPDGDREILNGKLLGLRHVLHGVLRDIEELLVAVNAAPPEEEEKERPRTFGKRD